jgi:hypothetical protein
MSRLALNRRGYTVTPGLKGIPDLVYSINNDGRPVDDVAECPAASGRRLGMAGANPWKLQARNKWRTIELSHATSFVLMRTDVWLYESLHGGAIMDEVCFHSFFTL